MGKNLTVTLYLREIPSTTHREKDNGRIVKVVRAETPTQQLWFKLPKSLSGGEAGGGHIRGYVFALDARRRPTRELPKFSYG